MSKYDELERLARLKEQGVLSEEEFQAQKKKLLDEPAQAAPTQLSKAEKRKANLPLILVLSLAPIAIAISMWLMRPSKTAQEQTSDTTMTSLQPPVDTVQQAAPSPELTSAVVDAAVEDVLIRQIRRSELEGVHTRKSEKLQIERGDLDHDNDDDVAVLFSLVNTTTNAFAEYLVVLTNDGMGKLRFTADRPAGIDDQTHGSSWDLKGITSSRILVEATEWSTVENSDGTSERRTSSTVHDFKLAGGRIVEVQ